MIRNKEIDRLEDEIYRIGRDAEEQIHPLHVQMKRIRNSCSHERDDVPGLENPWWCGKCGGQMPCDSVLTEQDS